MAADLVENFKEIQFKIDNSARKAGRDPKDIMLLAVSKTVSADTVRELYELGQRDFGENRIQEIVQKSELLPDDIRWHMIGRIQKNKLKYIAGKTALIHSLCSESAAAELQRLLCARDAAAECLIEINMTGEESKDGISPGELRCFADKLYELDRIFIRGLMTIGRYSPDPEDSRQCFAQLKKLFDTEKKERNERYSMDYLSMGMSGDYTVAVEEGANIVRIGTALFGERVYF